MGYVIGGLVTRASGIRESCLKVSLGPCSEGLVWGQESALGSAVGYTDRVPLNSCVDRISLSKSLGGSLGRQKLALDHG